MILFLINSISNIILRVDSYSSKVIKFFSYKAFNFNSLTSSDLVIAVDLNGKTAPNGKKKAKTLVDEDNIFSKILAWLPLNNQHELHENEDLAKGKSITDLLSNSYNMTQDKVTELMIDKYKPEILIEISRESCSVFDFHKTKMMMDLGYELAMRKIEEFENGN